MGGHGGGGGGPVKQITSSLIQNSENKLQSPTLNVNSSLELDFLSIKEVFHITEVGVIRLSKLIPEYADNYEIFGEEFKRKVNFYKNFLGVDIRVNITENELFAGYKKASIDIDGKHNMQVWNHILNHILPDLEKDGFKKSFISLEIIKDLPKEILDDYMKLVSADFVLEKGNVIKDIVLWLEFALSTKYSKEKGLGDIGEIIKGNNDLEHLMMMIAHVSKMDKDFQETLELLYIKLVRYKDPKVQGLLRFLGHNVEKNVSEKKLIDKARSRFSISVAKLLGNFGKKEEKPKKKIQLKNFRSAKKLLGKGEDKKIGYISGEKIANSTRILNTGIVIEKDWGHFVDESYYVEFKNIYDNLCNAINSKGKTDLFDEVLLKFEKEIEKKFLKIGLDYKKYKAILFDLIGGVNSPRDLGPIWISLKEYLSNNVTFVKGLKKSLGTDVVIDGRKNANYIPELEWKGEIRLSSGGGDSIFLVNLDKKDFVGFSKLSNYLIKGDTIDLSDLFGKLKIVNIVLRNECGRELDDKMLAVENNKIIFKGRFSHGDHEISFELNSGERFSIKCHIDPSYYREREVIELIDVRIKKIEPEPDLKTKLEAGEEVNLLEDGEISLLDNHSSGKTINLTGIIEDDIDKLISYTGFFKGWDRTTNGEEILKVKSKGKTIIINYPYFGEFGKVYDGVYEIKFEVSGKKYQLKFDVKGIDNKTDTHRGGLSSGFIVNNFTLKKEIEEQEDPRLPFAKAVAEIFELDKFNGIATLEEVFLSRKSLDIKEVFRENFSKYITGNIHFTEDGKITGKATLDINLITSDFLKTFRDRLNLLVIKNFTSNDFEFDIENVDLEGFEKVINEIYSFIVSLKQDTKEKEEELIGKIDIEKFKYNPFMRDLFKQIIISENKQKDQKYSHIFKELSKTDTEIKGWYYADKISKITSFNSIPGLIRTTGFHFNEMRKFFSDELKQKFLSKIEFLFEAKTGKQIESSIKELEKYFSSDSDILERVKKFLFSIEDNNFFDGVSSGEITEFVMKKVKSRQELRNNFFKSSLSNVNSVESLKSFNEILEKFNEVEQKLFWEYFQDKIRFSIQKELNFNELENGTISFGGFKAYGLSVILKLDTRAFGRANLIELFTRIINDELIIEFDEKLMSLEDVLKKLDEINLYHKELFGNRDFSEEDFKKLIIENIKVFQNDKEKLEQLKHCMNVNGYMQDKSFGEIFNLLSKSDEDFGILYSLLKKYGEVKLLVEIDHKYGDSYKYNTEFKEFLDSEETQRRLFKLGIYKIEANNGFRNTSSGVLHIDSKDGKVSELLKVLNLLEHIKENNINSVCKVNIDINFSGFLKDNKNRIFRLLNSLFSQDIQARLKDKGINEIDISNIYSFNDGNKLNISSDTLDELQSGEVEINDIDSKLNRTLNKKETLKMQELLEYIFNNN